MRDALAVAGAFLADVGARNGPWLPPFRAWAEARGLSEGEQRAVRAAVLRVRAFGAKVPSRRRRRLEALR